MVLVLLVLLLVTTTVTTAAAALAGRSIFCDKVAGVDSPSAGPRGEKGQPLPVHPPSHPGGVSLCCLLTECLSPCACHLSVLVSMHIFFFLCISVSHLFLLLDLYKSLSMSLFFSEELSFCLFLSWPILTSVRVD